MEATHSLVESVHISPYMAVVAVAGAGGQALAWLLGAPGASRTVLEAIVPYSRRSIAELLGREPEQYVTPRVAREMAEAAYTRALQLREMQEPVLGLACTAAISTDRPRRGDHRCCVAAWDDVGVTTYDLGLAKGERDRAGEEDLVSRLILHALGEACKLGHDLPPALLEGERLQVQRSDHADLVQLLLAKTSDRGWGGGVRTVTVYPDGSMAANEPIRAAAVLPGSFSPLHQGHERLAQVASHMVRGQVIFEISVLNVDKPALEEEEVRRRLRQFQGRRRVVLTRAPIFREKAALFPGCAFVIGWDTAQRLLHPRYYGGRKRAMMKALEEIRDAGCKFLVAGRLHEGVFRTLTDVPIPKKFADLFEAIPENWFREDVSSTNLR